MDRVRSSKNSDATSWHDFCTSSALFAPILEGNQRVPNATKQFQRHQKVSLVSNGVDRVHSLRKVRRDFVARTFAQVRPNSPECNQIVRNAPKRQFRVQRGGSGSFIAKNSDATSWHELLH